MCLQKYLTFLVFNFFWFCAGVILEDGHHQQKDTDPHLVQGWDQQVEQEEEWLHQVVSLLKLT